MSSIEAHYWAEAKQHLARARKCQTQSDWFWHCIHMVRFCRQAAKIERRYPNRYLGD